MVEEGELWDGSRSPEAGFPVLRRVLLEEGVKS